MISDALVGNRKTGVAQGSGQSFTDIPDGHYVGSTGAQPCIIVIIVSPPFRSDATTRIRVYHFDAGDDPIATLNRDRFKFTKGSRIALAGGDAKDPISMGTLEAIWSFIAHSHTGLHFDGIHNTPGLWVDNNGTYYVTEIEMLRRTIDGTRTNRQ